MAYEPEYVKANEQGRPTERENKPLTFENFSLGTDQHNPSTSPTGGITRIINGRCTRGTTLDRRPGKIVYGTAGDAGKVYMEASMQVSNGSDIHFRLVEGDGAGVQLQKYTTDWEDVGTNIGTADDRVDWFWTSVTIAGEDRLYFTNGVSNLQYTQGTTITEVAGVKAKYITHVGTLLVIGHPTETFDSNVLLYSKANTHQFNNDLDADYANSTQKFSMPGEITQVKSFNSLIYAFTKADGLWEIDLNDDSYRQISTHGTISPKSVDIDWDVMVWLEQNGVWALPIGGDVLKVSTTVDNIISQISATNLFQVVGTFNTNGAYELHVGDLTYEGIEYTNYCLVYEIEQSRELSQNTWKEDFGKEFPNCAVRHTNSYGFTQHFYGSRTNQTTYQNDYGYADGADVTIEMTMITADVVLATEKQQALLEDVYIVYEPNGSETIPFQLYARMDTEDWQLLKNSELPTGSSSMKTVRIQGVNGLTGRSLAFKLVSDDDKSFRLYKIFATYGITNAEITETLL